MKKIALTITTMLAIGFGASSFAVNTISNNYMMSQPSKALTKATATMHAPTDITVINASSAYIRVGVPGVTTILNPGYNNHTTSATKYNSTPLYLSDPYNNVFYSANVCNLAIVTVYGAPGNYGVNYDNALCY